MVEFCTAALRQGESGQLGNGANAYSVHPVMVAGNHHFVAISGGRHACALDTEGTAWCWGEGQYGGLGNGTTTSSNVPVAVSGGHSFTAISAGMDLTCALDAEGAAWCWGQQSSGQSTVPVKVGGEHAFVDISSQEHACALDTEGAAWCWGGGYKGRLGNGTTTGSNVPVPVSGGQSFAEIQVGHYHSCALDTEGAVWCWGSDEFGTLGNGPSGSSNVPVAVSGERSYEDMVSGSYHACALDTEGGTWCWGRGDVGSLGDGGTLDSQVPIGVYGGHRFSHLSAGGNQSCALDTENAVWCWGNFKLVPTSGWQNSCESPSGDAGDMLYNDDFAVLQWCDGTQWIGFPKPEVGCTPETSGWVGSSAVAGTWRDLAYGDGKFVAISDTPGRVSMRSVDGGVTWAAGMASDTSGSRAPRSGFSALSFAMSGTNPIWLGLYAINGTTGNPDYGGPSYWIGASDGESWAVRQGSTQPWLKDMAFGNDRFVGVTTPMDSLGTMLSVKAMLAQANFWRALNNPDPVPSGDWESITYGDGQFVSVASGGDQSVMTLADGSDTWVARPAPDKAWQAVTYSADQERYVAVGTNAAMSSPDGINWTEHDVPDGDWIGVAYGDGAFVAVANSGENHSMISADGENWTPLDAPEEPWRDVIYGDGKFVAVGSGSTYRAMSLEIESMSCAGGGGEIPSSGSCESPSGEAGAVLYNADHEVMQWCDGTQWIALPKPAPADRTAPVWVTGAMLPDGASGVAYDEAVEATDDSGSISYSLVGAAPSWLSFNAANGNLEGIPDSGGNYEVTVRAEDPSGNYADRTFTIEISQGAYACTTPLVIGCIAADGAIYAGMWDNHFIYSYPETEPTEFAFLTNYDNNVDTLDADNGLANTNILAAAGIHKFPAAQACRIKGSQWYLPSINELTLFYQAKDIGTFPDVFNTSRYVSSTQASTANRVLGERIGRDGDISENYKTSEQDVVCARRESAIDACETGPVGTACSDGAIYAGSLGGTRLYAAPADEGNYAWSNDETTTGATSKNDGLSNTDLLAGLTGTGPYPAASACRARGSQWYLPSTNELAVLYANKSDIGGFDHGGWSYYWASTEVSAGWADVLNFSNGQIIDPPNLYVNTKLETMHVVRCVRRQPPPDTTPPQWETTSVPNGTVGLPYNASIKATDDSGMVVYKFQGSFPGWMSYVQATGMLTGTPTYDGTLDIIMRASDPSGNYADRTFTIEIAE